MAKTDHLNGLNVLAVDDEPDVLETIVDTLDTANVETATTFEEALHLIENKNYDLAILDIMGVNGLELLKKTVEKGIPTVMLTAHAISVETLLESIRLGAISYLPKEKLAELDSILNEILKAQAEGTPTWKLLFEKLGEFFDKKFGPNWKEKDKEFWTEFSRTYHIGKGLKERLSHDKTILSKGI